MKRFLAIALILMMLSLPACHEQTQQSTSSETHETDTPANVLTDEELEQLIIGAWTWTIDLGRNKNDDNEYQLRNLESGEYDDAANKEELYTQSKNYKEYQEGAYLASCTSEFSEDGTFTKAYDKEELWSAYENLLVEYQHHYYEAAGTPYIPWDEDALQNKVAISIDSMTKNTVYQYEIIDGILYFNQSEQGKITIDEDKMTITPTETSYPRDLIVYTRVS